MAQHTLLLSSEIIQTMQQYYAKQMLSAVEYSIFRAKKNGVTITAYQSGKVLFQGARAIQEAQKWTEEELDTSPAPTKPNNSTSSLPENFSQWTIIGSDEVGNGSYFGALTVCAVYLPADKQDLMKELGVKDSKALSDKQIVNLAWQIKASVPYHLTVCPPHKYNEANQTRNANGIKVALHNFTIQKLVAKLSEEEQASLQGVLIDQFVAEKKYYDHLKKEQHPYTTNVYFEKKGESHHLAVACASIIARAAFLESLETLGKQYHIVLPSGAGANVDHIGVQLVKKYGPHILPSIAKMHFANTKKIMNKL
ncbi:ribonuclease HIII [Tuanshanicoccus lijuaniae]|uniref:ribonuclease HIII n=1 Tax=Aerococcaceae bacterium zg-1292 TaxID=2774330 RepID=UPI001BD85DFB|nr:ribonuclease HIII [Aerococcaceae bacterium zg-A91]MBS4458588.1 ribonuclease HIII [Aerococcaceae bacterium zg-BR33]